MGFWDLFFEKPKQPAAPTAKPQPKPAAPAIPPEYTVLNLNPHSQNLSIGSSSLKQLLCKDGFVYWAYWKDGKFSPSGPIGSFKLRDDGRWYDVYSKSKTQIGSVSADGKCISLTLYGMYLDQTNLHKQGLRYNEPRFPKDNLVWLVAEANESFHGIYDDEDGDMLGTFRGDPIAASAAFICYVYEWLGDDKYGRYFQNYAQSW